jgi:hypothetical protein
MTNKQEILAEILAFHEKISGKIDEMLPEDVTYSDLERTLKLSHGVVRKLMKNLVEQGSFHRLTVKTSDGRKVTVFRKAA